MRWAIHIFAGTSAILFLMSAILFVRGHWVSDELHAGRRRPAAALYDDLHIRCSADSLEVRFAVSTQRPDWLGNAPAAGISWMHQTHRPARVDAGPWLWWDHYVDQQRAYTTECWRLELRPWLFAMMFAVLPAWRGLHIARRLSARREGHCRACGYNLTGNVSGVCPECGMAVHVQPTDLQGM